MATNIEFRTKDDDIKSRDAFDTAEEADIDVLIIGAGINGPDFFAIFQCRALIASSWTRQISVRAPVPRPLA